MFSRCSGQFAEAVQHREIGIERFAWQDLFMRIASFRHRLLSHDPGGSARAASVASNGHAFARVINASSTAPLQNHGRTQAVMQWANNKKVTP